MRVIIISTFLICTLFFQPAKSQWNIFPINQVSYYRFDILPDRNIDMVFLDSLKIVGNESWYYSRKKIQNPGATSCRNEIYPVYLQMISNPGNAPLVDSLVVRNDTVFHNFDMPLNYFLPNAYIGQSWTLNFSNPVTYYCDSLGIDTVLGQTDSIKYFHTNLSIANPVIKLSKRFGFIDFIPFFDTPLNPFDIRHPYLIGLSDFSGNYGFQPIPISDFFPYHAGDILRWDYDNFINAGPGSFHEYYQDSITQIFATPDSFVYIYDRLIIDQNYNVLHQNGLRKSFSDKNFFTLLNTPLSDIGVFWSSSNSLPNQAELYNTSTLNILSDSVQNNDFYYRSFRSNRYLIDSNCYAYELIGGLNVFHLFFTNQGLVDSRYTYNLGYWEYRLVGSRIGNNVYGNPYLNVGINDLENLGIKIFPNPLHDKFYLNLKTNAQFSISIYNVLGKKIFESQISGAQNEIDVSEIPDGIYLLNLETENKKIISKLIKQ